MNRHEIAVEKALKNFVSVYRDYLCYSPKKIEDIKVGYCRSRISRNQFSFTVDFTVTTEEPTE
jgi:hypothetical protein